MEGELGDEENRGIIPRAAQAIFERLDSAQYVESAVTASYLEIYNEELADLLTDNCKDTKLQVVEGKKGVFVQNLSESVVKTAEDVLLLMQRSQERRRIGETKMNKMSSRSHCLFTLKVSSKRIVDAEGAVMECSGKLHMVDLAGSERTSRTRAEGVHLDEAKSINRSLTALGASAGAAVACRSHESRTDGLRRGCRVCSGQHHVSRGRRRQHRGRVRAVAGLEADATAAGVPGHGGVAHAHPRECVHVHACTRPCLACVFVCVCVCVCVCVFCVLFCSYMCLA